MSGDEPDVTREEFERLKARVRKLETISKSEKNGELSVLDTLDSRDATVISSLRHGKKYTPIGIKRMYIKQTDIRQDETAKQRAKAILKKDFFKKDGRSYIYRGDENE